MHVDFEEATQQEVGFEAQLSRTELSTSTAVCLKDALRITPSNCLNCAVDEAHSHLSGLIVASS